jgi:hypothetical protein
MLKRLIIDDILIGRIVRDIVQVIFRELFCKLASAPFKIKISDDAFPYLFRNQHMIHQEPQQSIQCILTCVERYKIIGIKECKPFVWIDTTGIIII